jgi:tryptophan synthase alpha chain
LKLEAHLRARRDEGAKLFVPYVTGGLSGWLDVVQAVVEGGADAVEIGIPFSDPIMDGPMIQRASERALASGATPAGIVAEAARLDIPVPLAVMSYCNPILHAGYGRFADTLASAGIDAAIVPDLPLEEIDPWADAAAAAGIETVLLVAPTTTPERLRAICERSQGFVYGVSLLGVTGERTELAAQAATMGDRLKAVTDKPALLGIGISTPEQAAAAATHADGVIIGSAIMRRVLDGEKPESIAAFASGVRAALDA